KGQKFTFSDDAYARSFRFIQLAAGVLSGYDESGLFGHRRLHFTAESLYSFRRFAPRHACELAREHHAFSAERTFGHDVRKRRDAAPPQFAVKLAVFGEKSGYVGCDMLADIVYGGKFIRTRGGELIHAAVLYREVVREFFAHVGYPESV